MAQLAQGGSNGGALHPWTLRFLDPELERRYQVQGGAESASGYRLISLASAVVWAPAALLLPQSTSLAPGIAIPIALSMSALSVVITLLSRWATTVNRQHLLVALLTSANGAVIVTLAAIGGALPGYAVATTILLYVFGSISRTRFVYAAMRTAVITVVFAIAVATYTGPAHLGMDVLIYTAGALGALLALHILERGRRLLFYQDTVIREQAGRLAVEIEKSGALLHNILPAAIAKRLLGGERTIADDYPSVSVLFADIVGFTPISARLTAREVIDLLGHVFVDFDRLASEHGLAKIKTIGDSYMAVCGLLPDDEDHPVRAIRLGLAMIEEIARHEVLGQALQLRVGVHVGPVAGGVIGTERLAFDLWGDTVNVASRLQELAPPGRVLIAETTMLRVRDQFFCEPVVQRELRGHSAMKTFAVTAAVAGSLAGSG